MNENGKKSDTCINENGKKAVLGGGVLLAAVIATVIFSIIQSAIYIAIGKDPDVYFVWSSIIAIAVELTFFGVVLLIGKATGAKPEYGFKKTSGISFAAGVLTAVAGVIGFYMISALFGIGLDAIGYKSDSSSIDGAVAWVLTGVRVVLFAPLCEEILLRSGVLTGTNALTAGKKNGGLLSVVLCGLLFMLLHMNPEQTVYQFFLGCLLALLTVSCGSLIPAIIAHALNNVIALILEITVGGITINEIIGSGLLAFFYANPALFVITSILAAAGVLAGMYFLYGALKKHNEARGFVQIAGITISEGAEDKRLKRFGLILFIAAAVLCVFIWLLQLSSGISQVS